MDIVAQCYTVLAELGINYTIDDRAEGYEIWFFEHEDTVPQFCRKLDPELVPKCFRHQDNHPKKKVNKDERSRILEA